MDNQPTFYKYPRTPHAEGSGSADDDDIYMSKSEWKTLFNLGKKLVIQEKVDGANVSLYFESEWNPVMQKRTGVLSTKEHPQYDVFRSWCYENMEMLWSILEDKYVLFGEWLWQRHSVSYGLLPAYFIGFDIMEKATSKFVSTPVLRQLVGDKFALVPTLYEGVPKIDLDLNTLIKKSSFGDEMMEGVYVRFEDEKYVIDRCKFRRKDFKAGRDNFHTVIENNKLIHKE